MPRAMLGSKPPPADKVVRLQDARRSTPDSEVLASSDDEHDLSTSTHSAMVDPSRRGSILEEVRESINLRRQSINTAGSAGSQPPTPSSDHGAWLNTQPITRVPSNPSPATWSSHLRASETRREQPSRLTDLSTGTEERNEQSFPFSIPLHPTPKTYRSQSYSVGQMEAELPSLSQMTQTFGLTHNNRTKIAQPTSLLHRPSRPSMLSEVTEGMNMMALREEFDDDDANSGVPINAGHSPSLLLRQTALENARARSGASLDHSHSSSAFSRPSQQTSVNPETGFSIYQEQYQGRSGIPERRSTEITGHIPIQNDKNGRPVKYHTLLGFGDLEEIPQSRRHSLAELQTRRNSLEDASTEVSMLNDAFDLHSLESNLPYNMLQGQSTTRDYNQNTVPQSYNQMSLIQDRPLLGPTGASLNTCKSTRPSLVHIKLTSA